jgi:hypothetical protein
MSSEALGTWLSRIIRWAMAAGFFYLAWTYSDLWFFYLFAGVAFITGFMVPKRCIEDSCNIDN